MEIIQLENIGFSYNHQAVLTEVTHAFEERSFHAIVGPNGSGKTTLIKLLNRLLKPAGGRILLEGQNLQDIGRQALARRMAYVSQFHQFLFPVSVFDTVLLGRKPYIRWTPARKDLQIVSEILERLHLEDIAHKGIDQLSGGQRQRVFIARALAQQPEIILLDEPTASLDLKHQYEVMNLLETLRKEGLTIILAIHDLNLALQYCTDFLVLKNGGIMARGGRDIFTEELISRTYNVQARVLEVQNRPYVLPLKQETHAAD